MPRLPIGLAVTLQAAAAGAASGGAPKKRLKDAVGRII
jgi:hypothetical protein